jgi:hypothetical protein
MITSTNSSHYQGPVQQQQMPSFLRNVQAIRLDGAGEFTVITDPARDLASQWENWATSGALVAAEQRGWRKATLEDIAGKEDLVATEDAAKETGLPYRVAKGGFAVRRPTGCPVPWDATKQGFFRNELVLMVRPMALHLGVERAHWEDTNRMISSKLAETRRSMGEALDEDATRVEVSQPIVRRAS